MKPSSQRVAAVICERWMFMRGSNYGALIGKFRVLDRLLLTRGGCTFIWLYSFPFFMFLYGSVSFRNERFKCVVPDNIQTPTTEGISLRTHPPPRIFLFCKELMAPPPLSTSVTRTPLTPLEKSFFFLKVKE